MLVLLRALLAFITGGILTYFVFVSAALWYVSVNDIGDRNGGTSMGIIFVLGPLCALFGGIGATIIATIRMQRRARARDAMDMPPPRPRSFATRLINALLAGLLIYGIGLAVLWLAEPLSFDSYWTALAVSLSPIALALAVTAFLGWHALRLRHSTE